MRMVNRMIDITEGDILLDGRACAGENPAELRRHIGYVIQQIGLFPHLSIGDNIATVPRLLGWERKRVQARVEELLELISLPEETRDRYPAELSGGQRQRVGVARALAADPPLMLMDEPFGAIDPITRERLQNEFLRLQEEIRKTIVFVTHDIDEAIKMGDRIAIMREGGILAQYDTPERILADPADDFVARFVGLDRGLKRLALSRLSDLTLEPADALPDGSPARGHADRSRVVFVDDENHPIGRLAADGEPEPAGPIGHPDTSLRDALSMIMSDSSRPLVVVDGGGAVAGVAPIELIAGALGHGNGSSDPGRPGGAPPGAGRKLMVGLIAAAGTGPVIPNFGGASDACAKTNGTFCWNWFQQHWSSIFGPALVQHIVLCLIAVGIGFVIAFLLALLAYRMHRLETPIATMSSFLYTIPSLALFQILVPFTGLSRLTVEIALVSYTILLLFRNIVTGLREVPQEVRDAARGMGLTPRQILLRIDLPLAVPAIFAGLRVATVTTISLATVAAFVINEGLGAPIFDAIQRANFKTEFLAAAALAILLAWVADLLLVVLQRMVAPWAVRRHSSIVPRAVTRRIRSRHRPISAVREA